MNEILKGNEYKKWLVELKTTIKQQQVKAAITVNSQLILLYWDMGRQIVEKQENAKWGSAFIDQLSKDLKAEFPDMGGFSVSNLKYCKQFYLYYRLFLISQQPVGQLKISDLEKSQQPVGFLSKGKNSINQQPVAKLKKTPLKKAKQVVSQNTEQEAAIIIQGQPVREMQANIFNIPWGHHIFIIQKIKNQKEAIFYINQTIENNWSRTVLQMQIESNLYSRQGRAINNFKNTLPEIFFQGCQPFKGWQPLTV